MARRRGRGGATATAAAAEGAAGLAGGRGGEAHAQHEVWGWGAHQLNIGAAFCASLAPTRALTHTTDLLSFFQIFVRNWHRPAYSDVVEKQRREWGRTKDENAPVAWDLKTRGQNYANHCAHLLVAVVFSAF